MSVFKSNPNYDASRSYIFIIFLYSDNSIDVFGLLQNKKTGIHHVHRLQLQNREPTVVSQINELRQKGNIKLKIMVPVI